MKWLSEKALRKGAQKMCSENVGQKGTENRWCEKATEKSGENGAKMYMQKGSGNREHLPSITSRKDTYSEFSVR